MYDTVQNFNLLLQLETWVVFLCLPLYTWQFVIMKIYHNFVKGFASLKGCIMYSQILDLCKSRVGTWEVGNGKQSCVKIFISLIDAFVEKRRKILFVYLIFVDFQLKYLVLWYVASSGLGSKYKNEK